MFMGTSLSREWVFVSIVAPRKCIAFGWERRKHAIRHFHFRCPGCCAAQLHRIWWGKGRATLSQAVANIPLEVMLVALERDIVL